MTEKERPKKHQSISGQLQLTDDFKAGEETRIKIAVARDCRILASTVVRLKAGQTKTKFMLRFAAGGRKPVGVRLLAGPDVADEALRSTTVQQIRIPARSFKEGNIKGAILEVNERLYHDWLRHCRTVTLRGRVVCRRLVWDRIEQQYVVCDAPVQGALVTAFDVDRYWWWYRRDEVGSDYTDLNGNFEISFRWCCWWWRPWLIRQWQLDPAIVERIRELAEQAVLPVPIPRPDPVPDFTIFAQMTAEATAVSAPSLLPAMGQPPDQAGFVALGEQLKELLPAAPDLERIHIWPWYPLFDCSPDILFRVTQDCGEGETVIYTEDTGKTRWNVGTELNNVVLVANEAACCSPFCCNDPPDEDCLAVYGLGCTTAYPVEKIEQDATDPLAGYGNPGSMDRPFGGTIGIRGVFGDGSEIDYYKPQRRRISPAPTGWEDMPADEMARFIRRHYIGPPWPFFLNETVKPIVVAGETVLRTIHRFRKENPQVVPFVDPANGDMLINWKTADDSGNQGSPMPGLQDGLYELRLVGYRYDEEKKELVDQQIMALCPAEEDEIDPALHAGMILRLDNRSWSHAGGTVHVTTGEPDCDFPDICAVVVNEAPGLPPGRQQERCIDACGIARVRAGDTITIHFRASDTDGHLEQYSLTAHWGESNSFNVLAAGTLAADPDPLVGPGYGQTFTGSQGVHRAGLPATDPEHDRPFWYGGDFKVTVTVSDTAFPTCCAYLLRLWVWKRTTNGCTSSRHFHNNLCEFSFTVIREDLIGSPNDPSCTEICPPAGDQGTDRQE
ncbi:hypothetical protein ACLG6S_13360 [Thermodesulfobacteriota bacterium B35]